MREERVNDRVTIVRGDCLRLVDSWPADAAVVTDPPYGIGYQHSGGGRGVRARRNLEAITGDDAPFDPARWLRFGRVMLWGADHYAEALPASGTWIAWDKACAGGPADTFVDAEFAWSNVDGIKRNVARIQWKGICTVNRGEENGRRYQAGQKPVALGEWCMRTLALEPGSLVFDPYMGSGSFAVAADHLGLRYVGVEIDAHNYGVARERLVRLIGGKSA